MPIFGRNKKKSETRVEDIVHAIQEFVNADTWLSSRQILEKKQALLLSDEADLVFEFLLEEFKDNQKAVLALREHRDLVARCRSEGIDQAFGNRMPNVQSVTGDAFQIYQEGLREHQNGNLEEAIRKYTQALGQVSQADDPVLWPSLHHNLGEAFRDRRQGNALDNFKKSIQHFEQALKVRSRERTPELWAKTHNSLGATYAQQFGNGDENIEKAIQHFEQALLVYEREEFPAQWANLQNNLGHAYLDRVEGSRIQNLTRALEYFTHLAEVVPAERNPQLWKKIQAHMAEAGIRNPLPR